MQDNTLERFGEIEAFQSNPPQLAHANFVRQQNKVEPRRAD